MTAADRAEADSNYTTVSNAAAQMKANGKSDEEIRAMLRELLSERAITGSDYTILNKKYGGTNKIS